MEKTPFVGASRCEGCHRTVEIVLRKLRAIADWQGQRLLDVGCGEGTFTMHLGKHFQEVVGIDVQSNYIEQFNVKAKNHPCARGALMSASNMDFPNAHFDRIVSIETLEHIPDLPGAAREISRTLAPGGMFVLTVPNRLFPCENHGMQVGRFKISRAPFLTWVPFLHRRWANARAFTVRALDNLLEPVGLHREKLDYLWPTFEHGGNPFQSALRGAYFLMRKMEESPMALRQFGTSIVAAYRKELPKEAKARDACR